MARTKVHCYRESGRRNYRLEWIDKRGRKHRKSAGTPNRREAERAAQRLADELERMPDINRTRWDDFRKRFEKEAMPRQRSRTQDKYRTVMNEVENVLAPQMVDEIDATAIDQLTTHYWSRDLSPSTITGYLRNVRRLLRWACERSMLAEVPRINWPKNASEARGRPLTTEEFERLLAAAGTLRGDTAASWKHLLRGLWWSGLRISEAMELRWGDSGLLTMDLESGRPMLCIKSELSKNRKTERFPMAPEFFEQIDAVHPVDRHGFVFEPLRKGNTGTGNGRLTSQQVGEAIVAIGKKAAVKVKEKPDGTPVFASAHDLRRSFGFRWAKRVMPPILQKMMRHSDIQTTLQFYVTQDEQQTADAVWEAMQNLPPLSPPLPENSTVSP